MLNRLGAVTASYYYCLLWFVSFDVLVTYSESNRCQITRNKGNWYSFCLMLNLSIASQILKSLMNTWLNGHGENSWCCDDFVSSEACMIPSFWSMVCLSDTPHSNSCQKRDHLFCALQVMPGLWQYYQSFGLIQLSFWLQKSFQ